MSEVGPLGKVFWINAAEKKICRANLDGSGVEDIITNLVNPVSIAFDPVVLKLYWVDAGRKCVFRSNLDGSGVEKSVDGLDSPSGCSLGLSGGKVYFVDRSLRKIFAATHGEDLLQEVVTELQHPNAIALDTDARKVYWGDFGTRKIHRANLDGSCMEDLVLYGKNSNSIAVDAIGGKIYWANHGTKCIWRCGLNGQDMENIVAGLENPNGVALDLTNKQVYWVDRDLGKIQRAHFEGSAVEDVICGLSNPWGIAVCSGATPHTVIPEQSTMAKLNRDTEIVARSGPGGDDKETIIPVADPPVIEKVTDIVKYQWADEARHVKVYIDGVKEKEAVEAAKDGKGNEVCVDFRPTGFTLVVKGDGQRYMLRMHGLFREIIPENCKFRVSAGKRITVTLAKQNEEPWKGLAQKC